MKRSTEYEVLAEKIFSDLDPVATVKHNDSIYGHDSGCYRQIDVSIRRKVVDIDVLIIVQAKDHASPADVNIIGEFVTVINDVRADKGILICRSGFTKNAKNLAKRYKIELRSVHDSMQKDWSHELKIPVLIDHYSFHYECRVRFENGYQPKEMNGAILFSNDNGKTQRSDSDIIQQLLDKNELIKNAHYLFRLPPDVKIMTEGMGWVNAYVELFLIPFGCSEKYMFYEPPYFQGIKDHQDDNFKPTNVSYDLEIIKNINKWEILTDPKSTEINLSAIKPLKIAYWDFTDFYFMTMYYETNGQMKLPENSKLEGEPFGANWTVKESL